MIYPHHHSQGGPIRNITSDDNPKIISEKIRGDRKSNSRNVHIMNSSFYPKRSFKGPIMLSSIIRGY